MTRCVDCAEQDAAVTGAEPAQDVTAPVPATSSPEPQQRVRQPRRRSVQLSLVSQSLAIAPLDAVPSAGGSGDGALLRISSGGDDLAQHASDEPDAMLPSPSMAPDGADMSAPLARAAQVSDGGPPAAQGEETAQRPGSGGGRHALLFSQLSPSAAMRAVRLSNGISLAAMFCTAAVYNSASAMQAQASLFVQRNAAATAL